MNIWHPISTRATSTRITKSPRQSASTLDAAFAEIDDRELRVDQPADFDNGPTAQRLLASIRTQLAALELQREQLTRLMASLPKLPE